MYLGLDLGTSGLKAILIDDDQSIIASAIAPLTVSRPRAGWSQQEPRDWLAAADQAVTTLSQQQSLDAVKAIGLSGQMHGATFVGHDGVARGPCILWNDTRASAEAAAMDADPAFRTITGNIVFPGFTAPKVPWVKTHGTVVWNDIAKVLLPKDYLRLWLSGDAVSDMSDASGTAWLDVDRRSWSDRLLTKSGLSLDHMPRLVEGNAISASLRDTLADKWGMPRGVPIAGGGGDNAASAVGVGVVSAGEAFISLGTSGVLFAASDRFAPAPETAVHSFCHALPGTWHQMGVILAAGDALNWFARTVGQSPEMLTGQLGPLQAPGRGLFLPYLGGERTPHNDAHIRGAFLHLDHADDQVAMARMVIEGITHAFVDSFDALTATGTKIDRLLGVGGGTNAEYWVQAIATALDLEIELPIAGDFGGAFGAARLGMMAATDTGAEIAVRPQIARRIAPDTSKTAAFREAHARYRESYGALKGLS